MFGLFKLRDRSGCSASPSPASLSLFRGLIPGVSGGLATGTLGDQQSGDLSILGVACRGRPSRCAVVLLMTQYCAEFARVSTRTVGKFHDFLRSCSNDTLDVLSMQDRAMRNRTATGDSFDHVRAPECARITRNPRMQPTPYLIMPLTCTSALRSIFSEGCG